MQSAPSPFTPALSATSGFRYDSLPDEGAEHHTSAGVGSTGSVDQVREDFNKNESTRATGFMGKISDVTWMHRLRQQAKDNPVHGGGGIGSLPEGGGLQVEQDQADGNSRWRARTEWINNPVSDSTYHCDDFDILGPEQVDQLELPPRRVAEQLLQSYIESVHPVFPILGKVNFRNQMARMFNKPHLQPSANWFAILNLVFALGAKYSHLVFAEARGDERDHLVYFTRARMLGMDGEAILAQPNLQRIQIAGLMSFYLMSTHQINR